MKHIQQNINEINSIQHIPNIVLDQTTIEVVGTKASSFRLSSEIETLKILYLKLNFDINVGSASLVSFAAIKIELENLSIFVNVKGSGLVLFETSAALF